MRGSSANGRGGCRHYSLRPARQTCDVSAQLLERLWLRWNPAYHLRRPRYEYCSSEPGHTIVAQSVSKHYAENIVLNQLDLHIPQVSLWRWWAVAVVAKVPCCAAGRSGNANRRRCVSGHHTAAEIQEDTRMMFQDARLLPWKR